MKQTTATPQAKTNAQTLDEKQAQAKTMTAIEAMFEQCLSSKAMTVHGLNFIGNDSPRFESCFRSELKK